ncbi:MULTISPECIES: proteasome subunit alpha [Actinokineospora]|uniref:Proteasome subunit alpha n=1 Tax=Actinokineospora fastidiosa TaxID=1816 RepID=A0A918GSR8_9PSEU|nr:MULTISPECIES: proteasome subunit alpha [Actinokineospora]UVS79034.1 Proteasome subunit alpha [Actinokineospora sp. UTMC 2448]GGS56057.1 proteasome subunit alpha [Actinokineospora fastidiosa]
MTMPLYASPEQLMRDRSEYARKGIARGRSVVALKYADGVLFVAENPSATLHKVSEIYDRIGFAAAGRYSEYESLRRGGIRHVDLWGYSYDRRDVSARQLANVYAQTLGTIFTEQVKPLEVELCVAEVGATAAQDQLYRLTYDGSIVDEPQFLVMGGQTDPIAASLKETFTEGITLADAVGLAIKAFAAGGANGANTPPSPDKLEVAVLDRNRPTRAFRRVTGAALTALLPPEARTEAGSESPAKPVEDVQLPPEE